MSLSRLDQLYREVILDAAARPAHCGTVAANAPQVHAVNSSCGDVLNLRASWNATGVLTGVAIDAQGCTISRASATLLVDAAHGKTALEVGRLCHDFNAMITTGAPMLGDEDAAALAGVRQFPARVKCALLAWDAMAQLLTEGGVRDAGDQEQ
ncbi:SUF system NifU family Fe-S cluster assembly protein [Lacticaseibacillus pabuli]|uniref:SUF system NifU family Fe-S cluster assembly protein n=1 Tax=Lacticaseibacillus pabuli TaxID=3025672 RepID=A0ABY7WNH3_9LACO|nr:SUF system NifU family Fe-S cluster assembly protein [Lacticaseibacillus sp. KACC 23028]WDF81734.1 SUF system NifU family Fe-S cluster assembly protein [Lacticaseibacillus sp. KACC 23028]